jgi:predicted nucleotidyltransferase component of viral defense system
MSLAVEKHKNFLIRILKDIYTDPTLAPILGFKGGTAAYLFYGLTRFSVDLDFDLLDEAKEDYVFERIEKILSAYGEIKTQQKKRFTLFFELSYAKSDHNIKVEINRRNFGSRYELEVYFGISMKVMVREDMFAHKLVAMVERLGRTNRDIFDVWFFLQNDWSIHREIVEARTEMSLQSFLKKCIRDLKRMSDHHILSGIGELLDEKQKAWVKAKLRAETIFLLKLKLGEDVK